MRSLQYINFLLLVYCLNNALWKVGWFWRKAGLRRLINDRNMPFDKDFPGIKTRFQNHFGIINFK